ncbi:class I SAM-dependent methyltransferase [Patescibacteria group bacterium]|nr:class I SAM-dependent methyltransferase [Patescibacteria group bacterium]MBU1931397.1 class I SAM-dependent methyltransferase [Patescibacteria group bacterium]
MMFKNKSVKAYYRDCGKGISPHNWRVYWCRLRGWPSFLYQSKRIADTVRKIKALGISGAVLDAACGSGQILKHLPLESVGIEINPNHAKTAQKNAPQAKVIRGDIERIPYPENSFDWLLATEIFEHLPESKPVVKELWRVLKKGGQLIVTVPTRHWLWRLRFLGSAMYATEPQCLSFDKKSLLFLFSQYQYKIKQLKKIAWGLNYFLVLEKT